MDAQRFQRLQELFTAALKRPEEERQAFLDRECDDEEMRREVEEMLLADATGERLEDAVQGGYEIFDHGRGELAETLPASDVRDTLRDRPPTDEIPSAIGKYEILGLLGRGGFGVVYKARDPHLERQVAIKTCASPDSEMRRRFVREGKIAAGLEHPNIVTIHEFGLEGRMPYMVQEFLAGHDLDEVAKGLDVESRIDALIRVARGLEYAHREGVLHRDIKPSNVRMLEGGEVKLMDFGIARSLGETTRLTSTGMTVGTVGYLAPEQLTGEEIDARADVFSFGVLAYELFAGHRPFRGNTFSQVSYQLLYEKPQPLDEAWAACPDRRLAMVVGRCLERERGERYPSMSEVRADLEALRETLGSASRPLPHARPAEARREWRWRGAAAVALAAVLTLGWWGWSRTEERNADPPSVEPLVNEVAMAAEKPPAATESNHPEAGGSDDAALGTRALTPAESPAEIPDPSEPAPEMDGPSLDATPPPSSQPPPSEPAVADLPVSLPPPPPLRDPPRREPSLSPPPPPPPAAPPIEPRPSDPEPTNAAPVDESSAEEPMRLGDHIAAPGPGIVEAEPLERVQPEYPPRARRRKREAQVVVAVYVDERGTVAQAILKRRDDSDFGFNEAALEAARRTRFRPATRDGVAGKMWTEISYEFKLDR